MLLFKPLMDGEVIHHNKNFVFPYELQIILSMFGLYNTFPSLKGETKSR